MLTTTSVVVPIQAAADLADGSSSDAGRDSQLESKWLLVLVVALAVLLLIIVVLRKRRRRNVNRVLLSLQKDRGSSRATSEIQNAARGPGSTGMVTSANNQFAALDTRRTAHPVSHDREFDAVVRGLTGDADDVWREKVRGENVIGSEYVGVCAAPLNPPGSTTDDGSSRALENARYATSGGEDPPRTLLSAVHALVNNPMYLNPLHASNAGTRDVLGVTPVTEVYDTVEPPTAEKDAVGDDVGTCDAMAGGEDPPRTLQNAVHASAGGGTGGGVGRMIIHTANPMYQTWYQTPRQVGNAITYDALDFTPKTEAHDTVKPPTAEQDTTHAAADSGSVASARPGQGGFYTPLDLSPHQQATYLAPTPIAPETQPAYAEVDYSKFESSLAPASPPRQPTYATTLVVFDGSEADYAAGTHQQADSSNYDYGEVGARAVAGTNDESLAVDHTYEYDVVAMVGGHGAVAVDNPRSTLSGNRDHDDEAVGYLSVGGQSDSADSEDMDGVYAEVMDYEEGPWSPAVPGGIIETESLYSDAVSSVSKAPSCQTSRDLLYEALPCDLLAGGVVNDHVYDEIRGLQTEAHRPSIQ